MVRFVYDLSKTPRKRNYRIFLNKKSFVTRTRNGHSNKVKFSYILFTQIPQAIKVMYEFRE